MRSPVIGAGLRPLPFGEPEDMIRSTSPRRAGSASPPPPSDFRSRDVRRRPSPEGDRAAPGVGARPAEVVRLITWSGAWMGLIGITSESWTRWRSRGSGGFASGCHAIGTADPCMVRSRRPGGHGVGVLAACPWFATPRSGGGVAGGLRVAVTGRSGAPPVILERNGIQAGLRCVSLRALLCPRLLPQVACRS